MPNEERRTEIYELQTMLRLLAQTDRTLPNVNPDGIFGAETERAVFEFQLRANLPPTGNVDFQTWTAITEAYRKAENEMRRGLALFSFPGNGYRVRRGEKSDLVCIIQIMLSGIRVAYDLFSELEITGIYDEPTENAVRLFQQLHRLSETGIVDSETWDLMAVAHNLFALNPTYTG